MDGKHECVHTLGRSNCDYCGRSLIKHYQLDTGYACGGIGVFNGRIVSDGTAPIFRNLVGQELSIILSRGKRYKITELKDA